MQQTQEQATDARPAVARSSRTRRAFGASGEEDPSTLARFGDQIVGPTSRGVRNVLRSPVRLALVAAILGISLMFVAVMVALNASVQQRLAAAQAQIGTGITISPAGSGGFGGSGASNSNSGSAQTYISATQVNTIEHTTGVTSISEYITTRDAGGTIKGAQKIPTDLPTFGGNGNGGGGNGGGIPNPFGGGVDGTIPPSIEGLLPQSQVTLADGVAVTLKSGRTFTSADATADVAITSEALASANGWKLGSTFSLNGTTVTLVGLYTASDSSQENTIIVPFQTAQKIYSISGATGVTAYADSVADVNTVASNLRTALGSSFDVVAQSQIYTDVINSLHTTESTVTTTLAISAVVAALVIIFAVFLIVRERTQEIGLLRAVGASAWQIVHQFAVETLALGVAGAVVATALVALFAGTLARQFAATGSIGGGGNVRIFTSGSGAFTPPAGGFGGGFPGAASRALSAGLTPTTALLVFALGIGLAILASIIPAWYVTRVRPATALRTVG